MITTKVYKAFLGSKVTTERLFGLSTLHTRNLKLYSTNSRRRGSKTTKHKWRFSGILVGSSVLGYLIYSRKDVSDLLKRLPGCLANVARAKAEPIYSSSDVAKHKTMDSGIWVSYKDGVYDITNFVESHPGGEKILLGAGGPIEPFWNLYAVHQTPEVLGMLEEYRIGKLKAGDRPKLDLNDPFANEPDRLPFFRVNSSKPYNAEPPLAVITDSFITPNELFYVRNHLPVPKIDPGTFRLEVVVGSQKLSFSLDELKTKYKPVTITTTIQCAGNRRAEMSEYKSVKGLSWGTCAIGTARWTGVRLRDILKDAGFALSDKRYKHIHFNGGDVDISKTSYGASIPKLKAMSEEGDVIIAYKMNGVDIPRDHGYPLRAIVPGYVGARNVKWLNQIVASDEESWSHWQRKDYKGFSPSTTFETADYDKAHAIQEMPVVSAISSPLPHAKVDPFDGTIEVQGYAWSGGGRGIIRVEVSADGGKTWTEAELTKDAPDADDSAHCWAWTLWKVDLPVEPGKECEIMCKAVDSAYNTQPEGIGPIWNLRGFLTNSWHRVPVHVTSE